MDPICQLLKLISNLKQNMAIELFTGCSIHFSTDVCMFWGLLSVTLLVVAHDCSSQHFLLQE